MDDGWGTRGRTGDDPRSARDPAAGEALVVFLEGPIERSEIPDLCARFEELLGEPPGGRVICDVAGLTECDAVAVEALARLQLSARRLGCHLWLRHAGCGLRQLIAMVGLADVVPSLPAGMRVEPTGMRVEPTGMRVEPTGMRVEPTGMRVEPAERASGIEAGRQPEQREPPVGVEEVVQPDDLAP